MSTEKFDMIVKFNKTKLGSKVDTYDLMDEMQGITEIEGALTHKDPDLYIKESESFNVVLVELSTDSIEAAKVLKNSNPHIVSSIIPIKKVVKTDIHEITSSLKELAINEMEPGDDFTVEASVVTHEDIDTKVILKEIEDELIEINMTPDKIDPKWKIYVEVIGENTGLNIVKSKESICIK